MPHDTRSNGRAGGGGRCLAIAACVLALATGGAMTASRALSVQRSQAAPAPAGEELARAAARAIAHGERDKAEALAQARGAGDPDAAAVLARLAIARGRYEDAEALLRPARDASPRGGAALELGLLLR
ncbi:MAG: hypothetical protein EHM24_08490, partial [Acidobacteria bacterium]